MAVITRWPYYRGGRKAGLHCNMHLETGYSTKKSSNSLIDLCVLQDPYHELFCDFHASGTHYAEATKSRNLSAQWFLGSYGWSSVTYDWIVVEYDRPIKTNAFTPKSSQKSLRPKLVGRKNNYKTLRRAHKFDKQNSPTVVTRMGTPKIRLSSPLKIHNGSQKIRKKTLGGM